MAVNLSMLAGAGAQFFTDSGVPLTGGLVYTYAAGTTTPQATYTTSAGNVAHTNPIVLNSAGRVASGGEIWLTDAVSYKFVLQTSAAVTIATYDNVTGNSSGIYAAFAASSGSSLVGFIQSGTGAVATTVQAKLRQTVSVKDFGATGDGTTNDTTAIQAAITAAGDGTVYFPAGDYKVTSTLTVTCSTVFDADANIVPSSMAASAVVFDIISRTVHDGVNILGTAIVDPANGTIGIRVRGTTTSASRTQLNNCFATRCKYGIVISTFSVMVNNCKTFANTTNISLYSSATNQEINDINIIGGNHSGPVGSYSIIVSDQDFPNSGAQYEGARLLMQGFAVDGGSIKINRYNTIEISSLYFEGTTTGNCIELGTVAEDGYVANLNIHDCWFRTANYAIYCNAGVQQLLVDICGYSAIDYCALYIASDIYEYSFKNGYSAGSFSKAPIVHFGQRSATNANFSTVSYQGYGIVNGVQTASSDVGYYIPNGRYIDSTLLVTNRSNLKGSAYISPRTLEAGTLATTTFTLTTAANSKYFNAGDRLSFSLGGAAYISKINYATGVLTIAGSTGTTNGAQTTSQTSADLYSVTYTSAAPTTGTWKVGDVAYNLTPTAGGTIGWVCTTAGTPGTWKTFGSIAA